MLSSKLSRRSLTFATAAVTLGASSVISQSADESVEDSVREVHDDLYQERNWETDRNGEINLSGFTFRDIDLDGQYSVGDLPHHGSYVEMVRPDGERFVQKSNRNGYSNFSASVSNSDASINMAGEYQFTVIPPNGWHVTTDQAVQLIEVSKVQGSIGGWVMEHLPHPYGIAPDLIIRGNLARQQEAWDNEEVIATNQENGLQVLVEATADGLFELPVIPGEWTIGGGTPNANHRLVSVGVHPVVLSSVTDTHTPEERANSTIVGFDDLTTGSTLRKVPNGYGGLNWSGLNAISHQFSSGGEGYTNCTQSGEYLAYSSSGHPVTISRDEGFDFVGGYFGIAWPDAEGESIRVRAFRDDSLVADDSFKGSSYGSIYFLANYRNITRIELTTEHYWQFVVDDMEFIVPS